MSSSRWFQNILYLSRLIIYSTCVWLPSGFPADCLHRGVLQAAQDQKCICCSRTKRNHGANGRWKGKFDICWFIFIFLLLKEEKKKSPHCVPLMWVSWGTFCLTVVILCLPLSCACGIYESQAGSSVIFLSGWRFVHFGTWQGQQAASWNLSAFSFCLVSCCDLFSVQGGGTNVQVCAVRRPQFCRADGVLTLNGQTGSICIVKYSN